MLINIDVIPYSHCMTIIRRMSFFVIVAFAFLNPIFAELKIKDYSFSVSPKVGVIYGQSEEIVYKYPNSRRYESELLWDLKPLFYAGLSADFGPSNPFARHGLISSLSFKAGLPLKTGIMVDHDWMNQNNNYLTHYSRHDAIIKHSFLADASLGYSFRLTSFFSVGVFGEFSFMNFFWSANDGYLQYPESYSSGEYSEWNSSLSEIHLYGKIITYNQNWFILAPGVSLSGQFGRFFSVKGIFNYSPLIYCQDEDNHIKRNTVFNDFLYYGHYFKGGGTLVFSPSPRFDFNLSFSYSLIKNTRGDAEINGVTYTGIAGTGYSAFDMGLSMRIYFFGR